MTSGFDALGLQPSLVQAVADRGYVDPTPIQAAVIPLLLSGDDVLGQAQTGTGKTAAFSLPTLQNLTPGKGPVQALVLVPTRELALQVAGAMKAYGRHRSVRILAVYGGQPYEPQLRALRQGVDVVVGTPGRLLDLLQRRALNLSAVTHVVLDEADEMLSMGFLEDIEAILDATPELRQTSLFSATLPLETRRLADRYLLHPKTVVIEHEQRTVAGLEQRYYLVNRKDKLAALTRLMETESIGSAIVFTRTRASTGDLANALSARGFAAEAISGDLSQDMRERVMERFRRGLVTVLVATDVAARGLDIDDVSHVVNYDLPMDEETYVHRVGRTGRAGKTGIAISLVTPQEQWYLRRIEWYTRQPIVLTSLPTVEDMQRQRDAQMLEKLLVWLRRGRGQRERGMVAELVDAGHDPAEIAVAALKLVRAAEQQRPIEPVGAVEEARPLGRDRRDRRGTRRRPDGNGSGSTGRHLARSKPGSISQEAGMVRLALNVGKDHGVRPNDVVGAIAYHADIPGHTLGKIRIHAGRTLVDVPEALVGQVLSKSGSYRIRRQAVAVERW